VALAQNTTPAQIAAREKRAAEDAKIWNANPAPSDPRDFTGVWWIRGYDGTYRQLDNSLPPMTPLEAASYKHLEEMEAAGTPIADSVSDCYPQGIPRLLAAPYPITFDYAPGMIVILHEANHNVRFVHMDGKPAPAGAPLTNQGYSRGHWQGATLVIDTDHFNDKTRIDEESLSHGLKLTTREEITKFTNSYGGVELRDRFTISDPEHYTKPWTAERLFAWRGDIKMSEYTCEENNRNKSDKSGAVSKK
jgi:hypothetical protein